jgi:hypothetical protein
MDWPRRFGMLRPAFDKKRPVTSHPRRPNRSEAVKSTRLFASAALMLSSFAALAQQWTPGGETNRSGPVVVSGSSPSLVTHTLESVVGSKRAVIGVNDRGGGYINSVLLHGYGIDGVDIVVTDFGKGWQGSVRDNLHGGRYNPTQAGFRDQFGAPVSVVKNSTLLVEQFAMPLYGDPVFDFLATKPAGVADAYPKDGGTPTPTFAVLKLRSMKSCDPSSITRSCFATLRPVRTAVVLAVRVQHVRSAAFGDPTVH